MSAELNKTDRPQEPRPESPSETIAALERELHKYKVRAERAEKFLRRMADHWNDWPDNEGLEIVSSMPDEENEDEGVGRCDFTLGQLRRALGAQS